MALANARLHVESLKQQRLAQDLLLAQEIQKSFLPRQLPSPPGLDFVTEYRPAYSVGGDFYDVFWLSEDRLGLFIGDVAGKGVSAALLMARITSDLRVAALAEADPRRVIERVNRAVVARQQHDIFVTAVYLTLDVRTREVVLGNAGHLPPLVRRAGSRSVESVGEGLGTAIGFFEDATFGQVEFTLGKGDALVLFTDGALEATSAQGEQFGLDRFQASVAAAHGGAQQLGRRLLADLRAHVGDAQQYDDFTMIVCGVTG
jgi:serine phosphatase RsbU (regulator of sigma subunit)